MSISIGRGRASGHYIRKRLRTAGLARRISGFAALLLVVGVLVFRLGGVDFESLQAILVVVLGLSALGLSIAVTGLARVWRSGYAGGGRALAAASTALLVLTPFGLAALLALQNPRTNVAVTDGMLAADIVNGVPIPEMAADLGEGTQPIISGRRFQATAAQIYAVSRIVLGDIGWDISDVATGAETAPPPQVGADLGVSGTIAVPTPTPRASIDLAAANDPLNRPESDEYTILAVARGPILALPSDVTIRIIEDGAEAFVDMRSTSRVASWDLGQNRRFIDDFLGRLDVAMAGIQTIAASGADG